MIFSHIAYCFANIGSLQVSANLLDIAVACAMRRDGFSVSSNGKLGQPGDVAALMKEAQVG